MKKKKFIVGVCFLILIVATVIIYLKTDLLKTKEMLFWKYMLIGKDEVIDVLSNEKIKEYNSKIKDSYYTKQSEITVTSKRNLIIKPISIEIDEKGNNQIDNVNTYINVKYDNKDIGSANIITDEDYFLVQSELLGEKYIGFENNNLKEVARKFGLVNVDFIPNKIKGIDYDELFSITETEKKHFMKQYIPVFREFIKNKNYIKEVNCKLGEDNSIVNKYTLKISKKEFYEVVIKVLEIAKNDEVTLKFISNKVAVYDETNKYCEIDNLQVLINDLENKLSKTELNNEPFISVIIYKNKEDNTIKKVDLVLENNRTFAIYVNQNENKITIKQENIENSFFNLDSTENIINSMFNIITEFNYIKNIENDNVVNVEMNLLLSMGIEQVEFKYVCSEKIETYIDNMYRKQDVEFIDLNNVGKDSYDKLLNKVFDKIEGKNNI